MLSLVMYCPMTTYWKETLDLFLLYCGTYHSRIISYACFHVYCLAPLLDGSPMRMQACLVHHGSQSMIVCLDHSRSSESTF